MTADPNGASGGPADRQSWNRYAYTANDPVNFNDPLGLMAMAGDTTGECVGVYVDGVYWGCLSGTGPSGGGSDGAACGVSIGDPFAPMPTMDPCPIAEPPRDPSDDDDFECPAKYQHWINVHGADADAVAKPIGTTEANVLALSAYESGWGGGPFASVGAYFNLERPKPKRGPDPKPLKYSTGWKQSAEPDKNGQYALVAKYNSYLDSAKSFAYYKGSLFQNVKSPTTFGTIASQNGFGITVSTFVSIANVFIKCLE